jgi:hypothetical protein
MRLSRRAKTSVEEGEGDLVAGAVDDQVDLLLAAVGEADRATAGEAIDVGLGGDVAVAEPRQQLRGDRRVCLEQLVVGLGQSVVGHLAD